MFGMNLLEGFFLVVLAGVVIIINSVTGLKSHKNFLNTMVPMTNVKRSSLDLKIDDDISGLFDFSAWMTAPVLLAVAVSGIIVTLLNSSIPPQAQERSWKLWVAIMVYMIFWGCFGIVARIKLRAVKADPYALKYKKKVSRGPSSHWYSLRP